MKTSLRWRRDAKDTGLMRVTQGYRGWTYGHGNGKTAYIRVMLENESGKYVVKFYNYRNNEGIESNVCLKARFDDVEEAKTAGKQWFETHKDRFPKGE
jgi:hypothetical protein